MTNRTARRVRAVHGRPPGMYADPPTRSPGCPRTSGSRAGRWQVFGLAGTSRRTRHLVAVASQARYLGPSAYDGGRSRSPLRGSPGFPPGSLLRRIPPGGRGEPAAPATLRARGAGRQRDVRHPDMGRDIAPGTPQGGKRRTRVSRPSPATPRGTLGPAARRAPRPASNQVLSPGRRCGIRGRSCGRGVRPPPSAGAAVAEHRGARGTRRRATPRWRRRCPGRSGRPA